MKMIAATSEQMLEAVLFHLHSTGWPMIDVEKLVDAYIGFLARTLRCVYGVPSGPGYRVRLRAEIERDIASLEAKGYAQRTVSRVRLTSIGVQQAFWLKPEQAMYGSLLPAASIAFPPRA
jgi:hypothetical protein